VILILAATDAEVRPWLQACAQTSGTPALPRIRPGQLTEFDNTDPAVALLCIGSGASAVTAAMQQLNTLEPRLVLHVGLAGGLRSGLGEGDVLMVTAVSAESFAPGEGPLPQPRPLPDYLLNPLRSALAELPDRMAQGAILTADSFIGSAQDKRLFGMDSPYLAYAPDASAVREACEDLGILYVGLRAVSHSEDQELTEAPGAGLGGRLRFGLRMLSNPGAALGAARGLRGTRRATAALGRAIPAALEAIEVHGRA
jgi:nucleoside phosphorylase